MIENKFRGISIITNEFVYGDLIHGVGSNRGKMYILPITNTYPKGCSELDGWEVFPDTVEQFIGLKDKNGVEIYEGDIITFDGITSHGAAIIAKVIYSEERLRYEYTEYEGISDPFCLLSMPIPRVIGNIYENPELLEP